MGWIVWEEISVWPAAAAEQLFFQRITFVLRDIPENSTSRFIPFIPNFLVGCQWMMKEGVKWQPHFLLGEERAKVWGLPDLKQQIWLYREDKHKWISERIIFLDFTILNCDAPRAPYNTNTNGWWVVMIKPVMIRWLLVNNGPAVPNPQQVNSMISHSAASLILLHRPPKWDLFYYVTSSNIIQCFKRFYQNI